MRRARGCDGGQLNELVRRSREAQKRAGLPPGTHSRRTESVLASLALDLPRAGRLAATAAPRIKGKLASLVATRPLTRGPLAAAANRQCARPRPGDANADQREGAGVMRVTETRWRATGFSACSPPATRSMLSLSDIEPVPDSQPMLANGGTGQELHRFATAAAPRPVQLLTRGGVAEHWRRSGPGDRHGRSASAPGRRRSPALGFRDVAGVSTERCDHG